MLLIGGAKMTFTGKCGLQERTHKANTSTTASRQNGIMTLGSFTKRLKTGFQMAKRPFGLAIFILNLAI
jgi:hypothetical protein